MPVPNMGHMNFPGSQYEEARRLHRPFGTFHCCTEDAVLCFRTVSGCLPRSLPLCPCSPKLPLQIIAFDLEFGQPAASTPVPSSRPPLDRLLGSFGHAAAGKTLEVGG